MDNKYLDWSIVTSTWDTFATTSRGTYWTTEDETEDETEDLFKAWFKAMSDSKIISLGSYGTRDEAENACQHHYETEDRG